MLRSCVIFGGNDPYFSSVGLLLHGDDANNSTTFTDSSSYSNTLTRAGNTVISTTQNKFGGSSILFDGIGDYLTVYNSTALGFGGGNWTVECWVYASSYVNYECIFDNRSAQGIGVGLYVANSNSGLVIADNNTIIGQGGTIATNSWNHIAFVRNGNTITGYLNGTSVATASDTRTYQTNTNFIGANYINTQAFSGYIDELRITKGVARYTGNFTPPTAAFPNS